MLFFFLLVHVGALIAQNLCIQLHESTLWSNFDYLTLRTSSNYMQFFTPMESKQL